MTKLTIILPTDLLWNRHGEEQRYAELLQAADPDTTYQSLTELGKITYYDDDCKEKEFIPERKSHQLTNLKGIEQIETEVADHDKVYIGGIGLFTQTDQGDYRLSERGKTLREKYEADDDWQAYLGELLVKYFVRLRAVMYYLGKGMAIAYDGHRFMTGNEYLVDGQIETQLYFPDVSSRYSGNYTIAGVVSTLLSQAGDHKSESEPSSIEQISRLYNFEYELVQSDFSDYRYLNDDIEMLKHQLVPLSTETDSLNRPKLDELADSATSSLENVEPVEEADHPLDRMPNLLLQANIREILGDFIWSDIEAATGRSRDKYTSIDITGPNNLEPLGGNIILVVRRAMTLLYELGLFTDAPKDDEADIMIDAGWARQHLSSDVVESFLETPYTEGESEFINTIENIYAEEANDNGWVWWDDVRSRVCDELDMDRSEFANEVDQLFQAGVIKIVDSQPGSRLAPDGPPGYAESAEILLEFSS